MKGAIFMFSNYDDILTVSDVSEILYVGKNTVYELLNSGTLEGFRIKKTWRIPKVNLEKYIISKCKSLK